MSEPEVPRAARLVPSDDTTRRWHSYELSGYRRNVAAHRDTTSNQIG